MSTIQKLQAMAQSLFGISEKDLVPTASIRDDLDLDSLDIVELMVGIEDEFGLIFSPDQLRSVETVQDAIDLVETNTPAGT